MSRKLTVKLSELEYDILKKIKIVKGKNGEKLRNLLRYYISKIPDLKSSEYALKREENKEEIYELLKLVWDCYEETDDPMSEWSKEKKQRIINLLLELKVIKKVGGNLYIPKYKFKALFKTLLHDIATENKEMDVYSVACMATIQLLMVFGAGTLSKCDIADATIFINEEWLFDYATAMKRAREFMKKKKKYKIYQ